MKKIIMLAMVCFSFACEKEAPVKTEPTTPESPQIAPEEKPEMKAEVKTEAVEAPVDFAALDKKEAEATITADNAEAEADKLLAEIEGDLD